MRHAHGIKHHGAAFADLEAAQLGVLGANPAGRVHRISCWMQTQGFLR